MTRSTSPNGQEAEAKNQLNRRLEARAARLSVEVDELSDMDYCAVVFSTDVEGEERWLAEERADEERAARRARRAANDPRYAANIEREVITRRVWREQAPRRMRVPTQREWAECHPDAPPKLYRLLRSTAERQNAAASREWPKLLRRALRGHRGAMAARSRAVRSVPLGSRSRGAGRPAARRSARSSARSGDSDGGDSSPGDSGEENPLSPGRWCACGCGNDLIGRRPQTLYASDACRKRAERATTEPTEQERTAALIEALAASTTAREALTAFVELEPSERFLVVGALELDDDDALKLVLAPQPLAVA